MHDVVSPPVRERGGQAIRRRPSAVLSRAQLDRTHGAFERVMAAVILTASYVGTLFALAGGTAAFLDHPWRFPVWFGAIALQTALTALEWWYGTLRRTHPVYIAALAVDAACTLAGFGPLVAPWLSTLLAMYTPYPGIGAWAILLIGAVLLAWYPERTFIN